MAHGILKHKRDKKKQSQFDYDYDRSVKKAMKAKQTNKEFVRRQLWEEGYDLGTLKLVDY